MISKIKHKFPDNLTVGTVFADETNNVYPLDDGDSIIMSSKAVREKDFLVYSPKERFLIINRIKNEAIAKELFSDEIKSDLIYGGTMKTFTEEDFNKEVIAEVKKQIEDFKKKYEDEQKNDVVLAEMKSKVDITEAELKQVKELVEKTEAEKKEIVEANQKLKDEIKQRDRLVKVSNAFAKLQLEDEVKIGRIERILDLAKAYDDETFDKFLTDEVAFATKLVDNLVSASKTIPNSQGTQDKEDKKKRIERFIYSQKGESL